MVKCLYNLALPQVSQLTIIMRQLAFDTTIPTTANKCRNELISPKNAEPRGAL